MTILKIPRDAAEEKRHVTAALIRGEFTESVVIYWGDTQTYRYVEHRGGYRYLNLNWDYLRRLLAGETVTIPLLMDALDISLTP